jgi:hypothetical protein
VVSCACEMYDTFRDAYFGQGLRYISGGRVCLYPEELSDFQLPPNYHVAPQDHSSSSIIPSTKSPDKDSSASSEHDAETPIEGHEDGDQLRAKHQGTDIEKNYTLEAPPSNHGTTIVTWYSETDQENPHNWSKAKKLWISAIILLYTLSAYIGASLYTSAIPTMREMWGLSNLAVSVGLSIYVVGYGLGPMSLYYWIRFIRHSLRTNCTGGQFRRHAGVAIPYGLLRVTSFCVWRCQFWRYLRSDAAALCDGVLDRRCFRGPSKFD